MKKSIVMIGILALLILNVASSVQPIQAEPASETEEEDILVTLFRFLDLFPFEIIALPAICLVFSPKQPYWKRLAKSVVVISIAYLGIFFFLYKPLIVALRGYVISLLIYLLFSLFVKAPTPESKSKEVAQKGDTHYFYQPSS
ncbi:MAG: hypothetical protein ACXAB4_03985 [Candidatus Hodarchaeales archaeon]|jgi:hypothetical protein